MKGFYKKTLIIFIASVMFMFIVGDLIHVGDKNYTYVDYQILYDLDYPQAQLNNHSLREVFESQNRVNSVGKNLFDGIFEVGTISSTTGQNAISATSRRSVNYISVLSNTAYVLKHFNTQRGFSYNWYDSNYNFISASAFGSPESWSQTSPINAKYLRITIPTVTVTEFIVQLEQGTVATTYAPYISSENGDLPPFVYWYGLDYFELDLTVTQMDYWYNIYITLKGLEA